MEAPPTPLSSRVRSHIAPVLEGDGLQPVRSRLETELALATEGSALLIRRNRSQWKRHPPLLSSRVRSHIAPVLEGDGLQPVRSRLETELALATEGSALLIRRNRSQWKRPPTPLSSRVRSHIAPVLEGDGLQPVCSKLETELALATEGSALLIRPNRSQWKRHPPLCHPEELTSPTASKG
jgi:hypothetical protein